MMGGPELKCQWVWREYHMHIAEQNRFGDELHRRLKREREK